jgi:hypothetical protein
MIIFTIIALVCIVGLGWFWLNRKPALKGSPARTWPPNRVKLTPKRKFVVPF